METPGHSGETVIKIVFIDLCCHVSCLIFNENGMQIICATMEFSTATVTLADADGKEHCACSKGTCPVKSAFKAVDLIFKEPTTLLEYSMDTATEGTDVIATTRVLVRGNALTGEEVQRNFR